MQRCGAGAQTAGPHSTAVSSAQGFGNVVSTMEHLSRVLRDEEELTRKAASLPEWREPVAGGELLAMSPCAKYSRVNLSPACMYQPWNPSSLESHQEKGF